MEKAKCKEVSKVCYFSSKKEENIKKNTYSLVQNETLEEEYRN